MLRDNVAGAGCAANASPRSESKTYVMFPNPWRQVRLDLEALPACGSIPVSVPWALLYYRGTYVGVRAIGPGRAAGAGRCGGGAGAGGGQQPGAPERARRRLVHGRRTGSERRKMGPLARPPDGCAISEDFFVSLFFSIFAL